MVIIPKEPPVLDNLNSYYVNIARLLEHCQGEWGSGGIYFKSQQRRAMLYFDSSELLNGIYARLDTTIVGASVQEAVLADAEEFNFIIRVYRIDPEAFYFWVNLPNAESIYTNLSTEFTNLAALIRKLRTENLTGAIDVIFGEPRHGGLLFFSNGQLLGGSYSWVNGALKEPQENLRRLLAYSQKHAAVFNVWKIPTTPGQSPPIPEKKSPPAPPPSETQAERESDGVDPFDPPGGHGAIAANCGSCGNCAQRAETRVYYVIETQIHVQGSPLCILGSIRRRIGL